MDVLEPGEVAAHDDQVQVALVRLVVRRDRLAVGSDDRERQRLLAGRGPRGVQVEPVAVDLLCETGRAGAVVVIVLGPVLGPVLTRVLVGMGRRGLDIDGSDQAPHPDGGDQDDDQPGDVRRGAGGCAQPDPAPLDLLGAHHDHARA